MLFGAPGVGKGTFAKLIQKDFKFEPFSTGDYFRSVIKSSQSTDAFSMKVREILNSGQLVDDQIVIDIIKKLKSEPETFMDGHFLDADGVILDGVPRTLRQAELMTEFMNVDLVVNFFNKEEVLI